MDNRRPSGGGQREESRTTRSTTGGVDNRRPSGGGQREESRTTRSTTGGVDNRRPAGEGHGRSLGQRGVQQEERTASTGINKKGSIHIQN